MMEEKKGEYKILFVCLGNICRSPSAEAVMKKLVQDAGLDGRIKIDSAGIIGYHAGEKADPRMRSHAARRGYKLDSVSLLSKVVISVIIQSKTLSKAAISMCY